MIKPRLLKTGATIGVMAPSNRIDEKRLDSGVAALRERGLSVVIHPQTYSKNGGLAGTAQEKAAALNELFENPDIDAIIFARGGNGAGRMRQYLDYNLIQNNPKIVMGYSDTTSLLNAIHKKTGLITFHGPLIHNMADHVDDVIDRLGGHDTTLPLETRTILSPGKAQGPVIGGNLSLFQALIGTPWMPEMENAILFIEDCSDEVSRYDRMLHHIRETGIMDKLSGLVIGEFVDTKDTGVIPFGHSLEDIVRQHTQDLSIPVIMDAPFGHGHNQTIFPVGLPATLTARDKTVTFRLSASPFADHNTGPSPSSMPYHKGI